MLFRTFHYKWYHCFQEGVLKKDGLGEIKDFHVGHQYLDDNYPDLCLSAILLCNDDFDCRIISVT